MDTNTFYSNNQSRINWRTNMIEALDTLDEYDDSDITVYDEYQAFVNSYEGTYDTLYLNKDHQDYSSWKQYAEYDGFKVIQTDEETRLC